LEAARTGRVLVAAIAAGVAGLSRVLAEDFRWLPRAAIRKAGEGGRLLVLRRARGMARSRARASSSAMAASWKLQPPFSCYGVAAAAAVVVVVVVVEAGGRWC